MRRVPALPILLLLALAACRPSERRPAGQPAPTDTLAAYISLNLPEDTLYDKVLGLLLGTAIGDAMGAPTEMWSRDMIQAEFGHVDGLDSMIREPSPEGTWEYNLQAGGTTDDTRWKAITIDFLTGETGEAQPRPRTLDPAGYARLLISRYTRELESLRDAPPETEPVEAGLRRAQWLAEWVKVARPYAARDLDGYADAMNRFYGGEMVCGGMLFAPVIGGAYPGNPEWAYLQAYRTNIYDIGYGKDIAALTAAMTAAAMHPQATPDSLKAVHRDVDPLGYFKARLTARSAYFFYRSALWITHEARKIETGEAAPPVRLALPRNTPEARLRYAQWSHAYGQLDEQLQRLPFHPGEIYLIALTGMLMCDFDFAQSLQFIINYGRDNDTVGAVAGAILGALHGASKLPPDQVQQALRANRELGFDLEAMARRMTESILRGDAQL